MHIFGADSSAVLFCDACSFYHRTLFQPHGDTQAKTFSLDKNIAFVPGVIMSVVFPITQTRYFQLNDRGYYTLISVYNLTVALLGTVLFFSALAKEHNLKIKRRKLAIAILALVQAGLQSWRRFRFSFSR